MKVLASSLWVTLVLAAAENIKPQQELGNDVRKQNVASTTQANKKAFSTERDICHSACMLGNLHSWRALKKRLPRLHHFRPIATRKVAAELGTLWE